MLETKQKIIENICYTELVYDRINKKLQTHNSKKEIEAYIYDVLKNTEEAHYIKKGKNYYITNKENNIRITINSYTYRVITVDRAF